MKICVVGTGTMGSGIVQTLLQNGLEVLQKGRSDASLNKSRAGIEKNLNRLVEKGKLEQSACAKMLSLLKTTKDYGDCRDADIVIEAISEDKEVKREVLSALAGI